MPGQGASHRHFPAKGSSDNSVDALVTDSGVTLTSTSADGLTVSTVTVDPEVLADLMDWMDALKQQQMIQWSQVAPTD